ncbi:hypothetical protein CSB45_15675 [candidate division KSB3 bacterium]|uniref:Uncharacterized protein n=1 Tax=candidate division KSB3 bacterium TaxID=2044937 RepID=A0A2G6E0K4_9BACT|nr:MAG: hypothetical protein CSB45_15675 [candidate division KSB3 bacterium]
MSAANFTLSQITKGKIIKTGVYIAKKVISGKLADSQLSIKGFTTAIPITINKPTATDQIKVITDKKLTTFLLVSFVIELPDFM